jgi:hypothetical protein
MAFTKNLFLSLPEIAFQLFREKSFPGRGLYLATQIISLSHTTHRFVSETKVATQSLP